MFSIHCKVLRVGSLKKEGILIQNRRQIKTSQGVTRSPLLSLVCSPLKFNVRQRKKQIINAQKW